MSKLIVKNRYATVPNNILQNKNISLKAKWLWTYIQSKPDWWNFAVKRMVSELKEWEEAVKNWLKELEECWLLKRQKYRKSNWQWGIEYILYEKPEEIEPGGGNPGMVNPDMVNHPNKINNIKQEIEVKNNNNKENNFNKLKQQSCENETKEDLEIFNLKKENLKEKEKKSLPKKEKEYWNQEINKLIELIKKFNYWLCAWTQQEQRRYWKLLLNKLNMFVKDNFDKFEAFKFLLQIVSENEFYAPKIVWPKEIYYSFEKLVKVAKLEAKKQKEDQEVEQLRNVKF